MIYYWCSFGAHAKILSSVPKLYFGCGTSANLCFSKKIQLNLKIQLITPEIIKQYSIVNETEDKNGKSPTLVSELDDKNATQPCCCHPAAGREVVTRGERWGGPSTTGL